MNGSTLIGRSKAMQQLRSDIAKHAATNASVLIQGETGTGKQLVARAIHDTSPRCHGPFIEINCACLPDALIESELFGSERGAFTGADAQRKGKFELAHNGTLFLDEVGECTTTAQSRFLKALQERRYYRVGGQREVAVDIRVVAATNRNLDDMMAAGTMRADFYHRLSAVPLKTPPLRERKDDLEELVEHFLHKLAQQMGRDIPSISRLALQALQHYAWPGNVRELENVMYAAIAVCRDDLELSDLPKPVCDAGLVQPRNYVERMRQASIAECRWALAQARGSRRAAAKLLGLTHTRFLNLLKTNSMDGASGA